MTQVKLVHLCELREAQGAAYVSARRPVPSWTDPAPAAHSTTTLVVCFDFIVSVGPARFLSGGPSSARGQGLPVRRRSVALGRTAAAAGRPLAGWRLAGHYGRIHP